MGPDFVVEHRKLTVGTTKKSIEHPESSSLPADEGFGLEDDQRVSPTGPHSPE